jgi:integral membrane protein
MTAKFRMVAYAEAITYLVLLGAVFVKRVLDGGDAVAVMGPVHGIIFLVYLVLVLKIRPDQGWTLGQTILVVIAAALPFGGFLVGHHLKDEPAPALR